MGNGYTLARQWFDFAAENPDLITVNQTALYAMLIDLNNRRGWAEKFNFNTQDACDLIGVKNRKTVWEALNKLTEFGFVTIIYKANAPGKASVISIVNNKVLSNGCLDTSLFNLSVKRTGKETVNKQLVDTVSPSTETVDGHSLKQINDKHKNNKTDKGSADAPVTDFNHTSGFINDDQEKEKSSAKRESVVSQDYVQVKTELEKALDEFLKMRKKSRKPPTEYAIRLITDKLEGLAPGNENLQAKILNQSTRNNWMDVFELKDIRQDAGDVNNKTESKLEAAERRHNELINDFKNEN